MVSVVFGASGCVADRERPAAPPAEPAAQVFKRTTAEHLAAVLDDAAVRDRALGALRERGALPLAELAAVVGALPAAPGDGAVAEAWLYEPAGGGASADLLVAYAPAGSKRTWTEIPAYTVGGERVTLDAHRAPDAPVVVIETQGRLAMRKGIDDANLALQRAHLQHVAAEAVASATAIQTTRLDSIRLVDDKEPWISGAAEVYAVVSGVVGDNEPEVRIVDLPYLDNDGTTYTPRQIVIDWSRFAYQAANIQLFEHDDNTNYQQLVTVLIDAIGAVGSLAGYPVISAITEIANRIVAAIPASVFSNDDDYVDSYYTIEEYQAYTGLAGAGHNATVSLQPFLLAPN